MSEEASNVVSLNGASIQPRGVPNEQLIEMLEELLARARAGDVIGASIALVHEDFTASFRIGGQAATYGALGALQCIGRRLATTVDSWP